MPKPYSVPTKEGFVCCLNDVHLVPVSYENSIVEYILYSEIMPLDWMFQIMLHVFPNQNALF